MKMNKIEEMKKKRMWNNIARILVIIICTYEGLKMDYTPFFIINLMFSITFLSVTLSMIKSVADSYRKGFLAKNVKWLEMKKGGVNTYTYIYYCNECKDTFTAGNPKTSKTKTRCKKCRCNNVEHINTIGGS